MFPLQAVVVLATDKTPKANDVVAGWLGFAVFMGLLIAVVLLSWSLSRHLKKVRANAEKGDVFDASDEKPRRTQI